MKTWKIPMEKYLNLHRVHVWEIAAFALIFHTSMYMKTEYKKNEKFYFDYFSIQFQIVAWRAALYY